MYDINIEGKDLQTERIINAAIEVHKILGPGFLESIYEEALCFELNLRNIKFKRQLLAPVKYKELIINKQRLDLVVENNVIVEIKAIKKIPEIAIAQTLSYLKAMQFKKALIINFGMKMLTNGIRRLSL
ncbi:MAG: GxxExxY protein [Ignavibacteriaceae bacterium]|jgi:GxxExxY protein|nr:GxxExxY protein [Chlorobium sp.]MCW8824373.1 GxxExxY protein [Ignavibacteriaceae bacterium]MCW8962112.1 GxxExxY protein [Ignavibacteriaceae bacterium]